MKHRASPDDQTFREAFEQFKVAPSEFDHRAHVRLAYIYLCGQSTDEAHDSMKGALLSFLRHHGIPGSKYHETITRAWIMAVRHFMELSLPCGSAAEFIERNPMLLDSKIMLTHYSAEVLFSRDARADFVEPDVDPIPRYR
jgi:hypothetical protein